MNETTIMKANMNPSVPKGIFIFECVICIPMVILSLWAGVWFGIIFAAGPIVTYFAYKNSKNIELVITNKRIIATGGKFGTETNIPIDSISSVVKGILKTVRVTSSSGVIAFSYLDNQQEVYDTINKLINTRSTSIDDSYSNQPPEDNNILSKVSCLNFKCVASI